ncbi:unnamed protein product, partial [Discosporangium mesarthrocarpum]
MGGLGSGGHVPQVLVETICLMFAFEVCRIVLYSALPDPNSVPLTSHQAPCLALRTIPLPPDKVHWQTSCVPPCLCPCLWPANRVKENKVEQYKTTPNPAGAPA